ncbi:purine-cytosine permease family protein [Roseovarius sp. ZX-A-9]|uniref:purine-cytosine permease family protein n=1 Tax=Roseovarius sp. ZX-A-9 TaxID=3014783 RepID=UPI00232D9991|nr:cytosine permease [Roseovarius sp. ZX-A-9]
MTDQTSATRAGESADETNWPLLKSERTWSQLEIGVVLLVAAAATWCYIIGEYVGYYLNLKMGFAAMTAGSMIGMLLVTLAVVPAAGRYGIDSIVSTRPQFGSRGWIIPVFLQYTSIIGWNCLLLIFFGKTAVQLLLTLGIVTEASTGTVQIISALLACALVFGVLLTGKTGVERISNVLFFFIVGVGAWMTWLLLSTKSTEITAAAPAYASGSLRWDYITGLEIAIVSLLSWWPYIGAMVRVAPDAPTSVKPAMLGMGLPVPLLSVIGLAAILALGISDPSQWMVELGGSFYGSIALVFVLAANLGTAIAGVYATSVGLRSVPAFERLPWTATLLIGLVPVAIITIFLPDLFFNNFGTFVAFIGVFFAPLCGIQIVDYLILRRQRLNLRALYDPSEGAEYYYWFGINPAGLLGMAAGFATYVYLLNPISYVSRAPYEYITASLPAAFLGGLVFWIATVVLVRPTGRGGYK